jgi:hypothetical protein
MRYFLTFAGMTVHPQDPGFRTIVEARAAQSAIIKEELAAARRKWRKAYVTRSGDSFSINATRDERSAMWTRGNIIKA